MAYSAGGGFPLATDPGPVNGGLNFFAGGPNIELSTASQSIDVGAGGSAIDGGNVTFALSAFLGGFDGQGDNAVLSLSFLNAASMTLGSASVGPVTEADRGGATGTLFRQETGLIPIGTRTIDVTLTMTRLAGAYDDGYADNLSLVLSPVPEPSSALILLIGGGLVAWIYRVRRKAKVLRFGV